MSLVVEQEVENVIQRYQVLNGTRVLIRVDQTYLRVGYDAMFDRPRCNERPMNLFPVLVELLFCEIRATLDEANDADIASCRHNERWFVCAPSLIPRSEYDWANLWLLYHRRPLGVILRDTGSQLNRSLVISHLRPVSFVHKAG